MRCFHFQLSRCPGNHWFSPRQGFISLILKFLIFRLLSGGGFLYLVLQLFHIFGYSTFRLIFFGVQVTADLCHYLFGLSANKFIMPGPVVSRSVLMCAQPWRTRQVLNIVPLAASDFLHLRLWPTQTVSIAHFSVLSNWRRTRCCLSVPIRGLCRIQIL